MVSVSAPLCLLLCASLTTGSTLGLGPKQRMEFTFLLPAGKTDCFFQTTARDDSMEVEYQVIAGSGLDVGFALLSPSGHRLASDFRRSDGIHMVDVTEEGDYRLCFDNSFSKMSDKMVFFEVIINSQVSRDAARDEWEEILTETESLVEYGLEDIRIRLDSVHQHLEKSRQVQAALRAFEARDRYLLEDNLWRVSFLSCLNLLFILTVAFTQVYTLQRLFHDTKRVRT